MKKTLTLLLLVISVQLFAQSYPITGITISLPSNPDANTANWGTGTAMFAITASGRMVNGKIDGQVAESRILVTIKSGGRKICGTYTAGTAPSAGFNAVVKTWNGNNAISLLGRDCVLPPGDYELCVQFFGYGAAGAPLSEEKCKPFSIKPKEETEQTYQPPQLIAPANGTSFTEAEIKKTIILRYTRVAYKAQEPVTYRIKIWQLMEGQNGTQAMKANQPVITKDVDNVTQVMINNLVSAPCVPPYLCNFIWNVQALNKEGKPIGTNNGTSEPFSFFVSTASCGTIDSDTSVTCKGWNEQTGLPVYSITVTLKNIPTSASLGCNAVYNSMSVFSGGGTVSGAVFPVTITPNNTATISFTYSPSTLGTSLVTFRLNGNWNDQLANSIDKLIEVGLPDCLCKDCDKAKLDANALSVTLAPGTTNQYIIGGNINVSGLPGVYGIEFEVQSFSYTSAPVTCSNGVTGVERSGVFLIPGTTINGSSAIQLFNETVSGSASTNNHAAKDIKYMGTTPMTGNIPVNLLIGLPGPLAGLEPGCCKMTYNFCIRVKIFYDKNSCNSCLFTKCFQF